jgi:hypothetical protein
MHEDELSLFHCFYFQTQSYQLQINSHKNLNKETHWYGKIQNCCRLLFLYMNYLTDKLCLASRTGRPQFEFTGTLTDGILADGTLADELKSYAV